MPVPGPLISSRIQSMPNAVAPGPAKVRVGFTNWSSLARSWYSPPAMVPGRSEPKTMTNSGTRSGSLKSSRTTGPPAAAVQRGSLPVRIEASITEANPLLASRMNVAMNPAIPRLRITFVAPMDLLPVVRTSMPLRQRTIRYPKGIDPSRYPSTVADNPSIASPGNGYSKYGCR